MEEWHIPGETPKLYIYLMAVLAASIQIQSICHLICLSSCVETSFKHASSLQVFNGQMLEFLCVQNAAVFPGF